MPEKHVIFGGGLKVAHRPAEKNCGLPTNFHMLFYEFFTFWHP